MNDLAEQGNWGRACQISLRVVGGRERLDRINSSRIPLEPAWFYIPLLAYPWTNYCFKILWCILQRDILASMVGMELFCPLRSTAGSENIVPEALEEEEVMEDLLALGWLERHHAVDDAASSDPTQGCYSQFEWCRPTVRVPHRKKT